MRRTAPVPGRGKRANQLEIALADLGLAGIRRQLQNFIRVVHGRLPFLARFCLLGPARAGSRMGSAGLVVVIIISRRRRSRRRKNRRSYARAGERETRRAVAERGKAHCARELISLSNVERTLDLGKQRRFLGLGRRFRQLAGCLQILSRLRARQSRTALFPFRAAPPGS